MSIPFLLGPINTGASFMIVSIQNNLPYILNGSINNNQIIYYWEPNPLIALNGKTLGIFTASGLLNALTVKDSNNGGGIAFESNSSNIINSRQPAILQMTQANYATWWPPALFLSMAIYTISNSTGTIANIYTTPPQNTIPANNIIILPVLWYSNCTSNGSYQSINTPANSITNWFCLVSPTLSICTNFTLLKKGWTNISDCTNGYNYTYCPVTQECGSDYCNGPCSVSYNNCTYKSKDFVCVFDPQEYISTTQWWTSPYFIGSLIAILLIIIVLIVIIVAVARHGKKSNTNTSSQAT